MAKTPIKQFRKWLNEHNYSFVSCDHPGALSAALLVDEFLDENAKCEPSEVSLRKAAARLGYVSDCELQNEDENSY